MEPGDAELLVVQGGAIKALPSAKISGQAVTFSGPADPDKAGDFFTLDTDFDIFDKGSIRLLWEHNLDKNLRGELARAQLKMTPSGIQASAQLDLSDHRQAGIYRLAQEGRLWFSSGSVSHLVERQKVGKAQWVKSWPIAEISCTTSPAEERCVVRALKSVGGGRTIGELLKNSGEATQAEIMSAVARVEVTLFELFMKNFEHNRDQWRREVQAAERKKLQVGR